MKTFLEVLMAQPPFWRVAIVAVFLIVVAVVAGAVAAFAEELVRLTLGPVRLRLRIRQVRREQQRIAAEDAARERKQLNAVIRFPVH